MSEENIDLPLPTEVKDLEPEKEQQETQRISIRYEGANLEAFRRAMVQKAQEEGWGILDYKLELPGGSITIDPRRPPSVEGLNITAITCRMRQRTQESLEPPPDIRA